MKNKGFGLAIAFVLALCAMLLGTFFPIIGSSVFALILGIVLNELVDLPENSRPGLNWSGKKLLQYSIIFMGFSLPIATVASTGLSSLKISLPTDNSCLSCSDDLWESLPSEISSTDLNWIWNGYLWWICHRSSCTDH